MDIDDVVNWVRGIGPGEQKDIVECYYKGKWDHNCEDGFKGDIRLRPTSLGPGEFTMTVNAESVERA